MPSRDFTDVTLLSEDHDGPDDHDDMMEMEIKMKMIKFDDDGYLMEFSISFLLFWFQSFTWLAITPWRCDSS